MSNPAALKTLEDARWYLLDPDSWVKNTTRNGRRVCLIQAIRDADGPGEVGAEHAVQSVLYTRGYTSIPQFNDASKTTHVDIIEVLDKAIASVK